MLTTNGTQMEDLSGRRRLTVLQRLVIPLWLTVPYRAVRWTTLTTWRSVAWLVGRPLLGLVLVVLTAGRLALGTRGAVVVLALLMLGAACWLWASPRSFDASVTQRLRGGWRWLVHYRRRWYPALHGCGLTRVSPDRQVFVPRVAKVSSTRWVDTLHVRLLHGHTPEDLSTRAESLRHAFGAIRCTVVEDRPGRVRLVLFARDPLATVVPPVPLDKLPAVPDLSAVPVGRTEHGTPCTLRLAGTHYVVAAATGAGKSTLTWNVLRALGPGIAAGVVRVTGLDPKGGMELYPGRALFSWYEDASPEAIADAIDAVVERMVERKRRLRGATRDWTASTVEPFELVVVDELASLTAYVPDRKLRDRIAGQLQLLLSQGRAVGFSVLACLQDPRKDVLPFRDLYPTRVALRVTEDSHTNLVLGDGAKERGAVCHLIRESTPGVGFLRLDGAAEPVRVRFGHITDEDITAMAARFTAPPLGQEPAVEPVVVDVREPESPAVPRQPW